jgi:replicative DNA helicase
MKAHAIDKTRTRRSMKIESAIEVLSQILGSRDEVIAAIAEMLVADRDFTEKQREQIMEAIKKLHGDQESYL